MNAGYSVILIAALLTSLLRTALFPGSAEAALRPSDVTVIAEPDSLLTGQRLRYVITVTHDGRQPLSIESLATGQGTPFEITGTKSTSKKLEDGRIEYRMDTGLAVFGSGRQRLPRFTVIAGKSSATGQERLDIIPSEMVTIVSMTDSTITELRPIAPPVSPPFPTWLLVPVLIVLVLLSLVGYLLWRLIFALRRHLDDPVRNARQKLRSIRRQLSKGLSPAEGYESLSNILREFLQKRYRFGAMEMVTQEIAEELTTRKINIREDLLKLLDQADLVKFADSRPNIEECRRSLRIAELLVASAAEQEVQVVVDSG